MNDVEKNIFPCKSCLNAVDYTSEIGLVTMIIFLFFQCLCLGLHYKSISRGKSTMHFINDYFSYFKKVYGIHPYCDLLSKLTNNIKYNFIGA